MIAVDTSALVAIVLGELEAEALLDVLQQGPVVVGAPTLVEAAVVVEARQGPDAARDLELLVEGAIERVVAFDAAHARAAVDAWRRFGTGRHPATLTFGDCRHYTPPQLVPESKRWTIFIDGISKAFAATGLRVGWTVAPPEITSRMRDILGHVGAWAPRAEQVSVARYLGMKDEIVSFHETMIREVGKNTEVDTSARDGFNMRSESFASGIDRIGSHRIADIIDEMNDEEWSNRGFADHTDFEVVRAAAEFLEHGVN